MTKVSLRLGSASMNPANYKEMNMPLERTQDSTLGDILKIVLAVILPPLGVFLEVGLGKHFWINVILTLLGYIPGIIHAVYIIATR